MAQTTEKAFEAYLEQMLLNQGGWQRGTNAEWDKTRALFPARIFAFIEATQPKLWAEMAAMHGSNHQPMLLDALVKELEIKGALHVLRHGFKFYGKTFRLAYFKPAHGLNAKYWRSMHKISSRSRGRCRAIQASTARWTWCSR